MLADLEKAEPAERGEQPAPRLFHVRPHRRAEPFDVQPHSVALRRSSGSAGDPDDALERFGALRVELGEADAELATLRCVLLPDDLSGREDASRRARVEAARQRLTHLRQVRRSQVHPLSGDVDGLCLERGSQGTADFHEGLEGNARRSRRAAIIRSAHTSAIKPQLETGQVSASRSSPGRHRVAKVA